MPVVSPYSGQQVHYGPRHDIATGILFNDESERRPIHFVVQQITYGAACAALEIKCSLDLNGRASDCRAWSIGSRKSRCS
jgi:GDP-D-mannose dehydratase